MLVLSICAVFELHLLHPAQMAKTRVQPEPVKDGGGGRTAKEAGRKGSLFDKLKARVPSRELEAKVFGIEGDELVEEVLSPTQRVHSRGVIDEGLRKLRTDLCGLEGLVRVFRASEFEFEDQPPHAGNRHVYRHNACYCCKCCCWHRPFVQAHLNPLLASPL